MRRGLSKSLLFVAVICRLSLCQAAEPARWKAGAAKVNITPSEPVWMAGYASRKRPSEGVLLDLHAKSLALVDAENHRLVLVPRPPARLSEPFTTIPDDRPAHL